MMFSIKSGAAGSPMLKWGRNVESIRKDIECVFGSLKKKLYYLKQFNWSQKQSTIDNPFKTYCIIHNLLLEHNGWLDVDFLTLLN
jgi:hypothetical protein